MAAKELVPEIRKPNGSELALVTPTPMDLMQQAIERGLTVEQLQVIQQMHYAQQDREAKHAYDAAMLAFKKNPPVIRKTKAVTYDKGPNAKPAFYYAPLEEVCPAVIEELNKHGITHKWRSDPPVNPGWVRVTCVLTHELGHKEENGLEAPVDPSGGKNGIQAVISTAHYLERVTLLSACGLSAAGMDDDGGHGGVFEKLNERLEWIASARNHEELKKLYFNAVQEADAAKDKAAKDKLNQAKNKRYKELA